MLQRKDFAVWSVHWSLSGSRRHYVDIEGLYCGSIDPILLKFLAYLEARKSSRPCSPFLGVQEADSVSVDKMLTRNLGSTVPPGLQHASNSVTTFGSEPINHDIAHDSDSNDSSGNLLIFCA